MNEDNETVEVSQEVPEVSFEIITSDEELNAAVQHWQKSSLLALDTEFMRTDSYYPGVGLIQLSDGEGIWLIDPLQIEDWSSFEALMVKPETIKVFHSCSEDLLVFIAFLGVLPTPIFDTQIAATLLDMGLSISYLNLVKHFKGIELPKGETRSDWMQRPLTDEQLKYAALDVIYLPEMATSMTESLRQQNKLEWAEEEFVRCLANYQTEFSRDFSDYYRSMKAAWQYESKKLFGLQLLAEWREHRARDRNKPRSWIIKDQVLYEIAQTMPQSESQLSSVTGISTNFLRYEGKSVLTLIETAQNAEPEVYPEPLARPLTSGQKNTLKKMKQIVISKAEEVNVAPEYLGRKKTLVEFLQLSLSCKDESGERTLGPDALPEELKGWRGRLILEELESIMP